MKTVKLDNNVVREVIPEYALPVEKWYGAAFAAECMEAPDEVDQHWTYDPETGTFSAPVEPDYDQPEAEQEPSAEDAVWAEMAAAIREGVNAV